MIERTVLGGYILEELLASLVSGSGYKLLVAEAQDPDSLTWSKGSLRIHGRGADHQVDVLGELSVPVQLTYPLRLFLEAKCRGAKTDLRDVRNAIGTIDDVNQFYAWQAAQSWANPYRRFDYRYALASTSGFSRDAVRYAITHQVSLIDLSTESAQWLRDAVERISVALLAVAHENHLERFPVNQMREAMRRALGTWPGVSHGDDDDLAESEARAARTQPPESGGLDPARLAAICAGAKDTLDGRLFVAWTVTPFLFFVLPDDPPGAAEFFAEWRGSTVPATVAYTGRRLVGGEWAVDAEPSTGRRSNPESRLRFAVPPEMEPFIFSAEPTEVGNRRHGDSPQENELQEREGAVRTVSVQIDPLTVVDLQFQAVAMDLTSDLGGGDLPNSQDVDEFDNGWLSLRRTAWTGRREPAFSGALDDSEESEDEGEEVHVEWTLEAFHELLRRLRTEGWPHAAIIETAARAGGRIPRARVYELADYEAERTRRGFTRPAARIAQDMLRDGFIEEGVTPPLWAVYKAGVRASHFGVPAEFTRFLE